MIKAFQEMPPVVFVLSRFGPIDARFLLRNFKFALLLFAIAAAVLTPSGDATPMIAFMGVMTVLCALGILTAALFVKNHERRLHCRYSQAETRRKCQTRGR